MTTVPPGRTSAVASTHACSVPAASITTSAPRPSPGSAPKASTERAPLVAAADDHRPAAGVGDARREHQPDRPRAENRDRLPRLDPGALDAAQAARERLDHRRDLGRETGRNVVEVDRRDPLGHDEPVGVRTGEELELAALLAARAAGAARRTARCSRRRRAARRRCRRTRARSGAGDSRSEQRVPAAERLQVGAVGERDLDLHEHVARARLGPLDTSSTRRSPGPYSRAAFTA